jgi:hypothetical protein
MIQEQNKEQKHEERQTKAYTISDALHELEVDLRHNAKYPNVKWNDKVERTDVIRISGGWGAPSLFINKTQCRKWMREHFNDKPTEASEHWEEGAKKYVEFIRTPYWIWVSCGEERTRTEWSQNALDRAEKAREKVWAEEEKSIGIVEDSE